MSFMEETTGSNCVSSSGVVHRTDQSHRLEQAEPRVNEHVVKLVYITTLPFGQWWFLKGQPKFMAQRGFELHSITSPDVYFEELASQWGLKTHSVPMARDVALWKDAKSFVQIYRTLKKINPDMVQVSTPKAALLGSIAARLARVPIRICLITGLHSSSKKGLKKLLYMVAEGIAPRMCTVTRCNSSSLLRYAVKHRIVPLKKAVLLGHGMSNGLDTVHFDRARVESSYDLKGIRARLGIPESSEVLGFCGRLTRDKGLRDLQEAWLIIREQFPNVRLLLVGWWWEAVDVVEQEVKKSLAADPRVHITGRVEDPAPYYALMTMLIHPSYREGFPQAPMEAAAMELPVVATDAVGCVDAVVDGVTGTLAPVGDVSALVNAISRYLRDPQLKDRHGKAGRERVVKYFRQEVLWEEIYRFYSKLLIVSRVRTGTI